MLTRHAAHPVECEAIVPTLKMIPIGVWAAAHYEPPAQR